MPAPIKDFTGIKFGRLTVIERSGSKNNKALWKCKCRCGNIVFIMSHHLTKKMSYTGNEAKRCSHCKDSEKHPKEYSAWSDMLQRCNNKNHKSYQYYGGRGITVSSDWSWDFLNFLDDMGKAPSAEFSLERINNEGNYTKENCKWATWSEQMQNRRFHNQFDH